MRSHLSIHIGAIALLDCLKSDRASGFTNNINNCGVHCPDCGNVFGFAWDCRKIQIIINMALFDRYTKLS